VTLIHSTYCAIVTAVSEVGLNGDQLEEFTSPPFAPIANAVQYDSKAFIAKMLNRLERVEDSVIAPFAVRFCVCLRSTIALY
jgi:hypothetical protein